MHKEIGALWSPVREGIIKQDARLDDSIRVSRAPSSSSDEKSDSQGNRVTMETNKFDR